MRISDWSSDVCSSDLLARTTGTGLLTAAARIVDSDELTPQARRSLGNLVADFARWRSNADTLPHPDLARLLLEESGYVAMLQADRSAEAKIGRASCRGRVCTDV